MLEGKISSQIHQRFKDEHVRATYQNNYDYREHSLETLELIQGV